mgnify:CR=1 FL=1
MQVGSDHYWRDWTVQKPDKTYAYHGIDFARAYANESRFVFLKACSGWSDTRFYPLAIADARAAGLLAAPYVWLYEGEAARQADFWYSRLKDEPVIWIDFESYEASIPEVHDLYTAVERVRWHGYVGQIGIYTGHWYWLDHGNNDKYWAEFLVCLARYNGQIAPPELTAPWLDRGRFNCDFWQHSASGDPLFYGVTNGKLAVDEQIFDGTPDELAALFGGEPTLPPIGGDMFEGTCITASLNVRNAPSTGAVVNYLSLNDKVEADKVVGGWWHLTKLRGVATVGENWAYEGSTKGYIRTDAIIVPEMATITVEHNGKTGIATVELK